MIQPETNPEDAKAVATHLRTLSDAELSQAIASPRVLVGSLPGFALDHLRTVAAGASSSLAMSRPDGAMPRYRSRLDSPDEWHLALDPLSKARPGARRNGASPRPHA